MKKLKFDLDFSLKDRVVIITGSGRGIGKAIAILYAKKGARIVLTGKSDNVNTTRKQLKELGTECISLTGDLTKEKNIRRIVSKTIKNFGRIDILVNNAGIVFVDKALNTPKNHWDDTISVNLTAAFMLSQVAAREMSKNNQGKIINIASLASIVGLPKRAAYCSSKAGLLGMTKSLAVEWAKYNICVNCISPTVVLTEMGKKAWKGKAGIEMKKKIPLGRFLDPYEVAAAAVYLASDAADMVTGINLVIDGGRSIA
ncbi:MAG: D-threitol dehydrogenase [Candidatus Humimicrobiaceae bacterium]